jgi:hypothetical protein
MPERPDKQARTGNNYKGYDDDLPALQVEQVKTGCFKAIYEDNACNFKPNSNHQNDKSVVEFMFLSSCGVIGYVMKLS